MKTWVALLGALLASACPYTPVELFAGPDSAGAEDARALADAGALEDAADPGGDAGPNDDAADPRGDAADPLDATDSPDRSPDPLDAGRSDCGPGDAGCGAVIENAGIGTSGGRTCAVRADGTVACWGRSHLGHGRSGGSTSPVTVAGVGRAVGVAVGAEHACALIADGSVRCWGANDVRQLGDGTTAPQPSAIAVPGLPEVVALAADGDGTCVVAADRHVHCWGRAPPGDGRLGVTLDGPTMVPGVDGAVDVVVGDEHACALLDTGRVRCWGRNPYGQLGTGSSDDAPAPVEVSGVTDALALGGSDDNTCVVLAHGTARCWGANVASAVGIESSSTRVLSPSAVTALAQPVTDLVEIRPSRTHTCARRSDGAVLCWGDGAAAVGARGTPTPGLTPAPVRNIAQAEHVAVGSHDDAAVSCATLRGGAIRCWGANDGGQLGTGAAGPGRPYPVGLCADCATGRLVAGMRTTCAVSDGSPRRVLCWGDGSQGQLNGTGLTQVTSPRAIVGTDDAVWVSVSDDHACAARADGTVVCWGTQSGGKLGNGVAAATVATLTQVPGIATAVATAVGAQHSCALLVDGQVRCWGRNNTGQVGQGGPVAGPSAQVLVPTAVVGLGDVIEVRAGANHTCALQATGAVWCWGANNFGQLGDGSSTLRSAPVPVSGLSDVARLGGAFGHTSCAVLRDGTARCWGYNNRGQVGDGLSVTDQPLPQVVAGVMDVVDVQAGWTAACASRTDGRITCWGGNGSGQFGDGTMTSSTTHRKSVVSDIANAVGVSAGGEGSYGFVCAMLANGRARCWGRNAQGQLGDGTTTQRRTPSTEVLLQ